MNKGIEALERLEENIIAVNVDYEMKHVADYETIEKRLKALEIIKEKDVYVSELIYLSDQDYDCYLRFCYNEEYPTEDILSEEEFNLLKEVLSDE